MSTLSPRRRKPSGIWRAAAAAAVAALLTAACGDGAAPATNAPSPAPAASSAFPLTITHKFGSVTIPAEPKRIVTVGITDQDALLALGIKPVGVVDWYGNYPNAVWPWQQAAFGDTPPAVVGKAPDINFEAVGALNPDLIVAVNSWATNKENYDLLSGIAPVVVSTSESDQTTWKEQAAMVAHAVGRDAQMDGLIAGIDKRFAELKAANPEFAGKTMVNAALNEPGSYAVYGGTDARPQFFEALGFVTPKIVADATPEGYGDISAERFDVLDQDLLVWYTSTSDDLVDELGASRLYQDLRVHKEGRDLFLRAADKELNGAMSWSTVLSLPVALDKMVPKLPAMLDGNPATLPAAS